jgi:hypothetical protein
MGLDKVESIGNLASGKGPLPGLFV